MIKTYKIFAGIFSLTILSVLAATLFIQTTIPDSYNILEGETLFVSKNLTFKDTAQESDISVATNLANRRFNLDAKLLGAIQVKQVSVNVVKRKMVVPGGYPFGIKMHTRGVIVVGLSDIQKGTKNINPAKDAGLKVGDIITGIDDYEITKNNDVADIISASDGSEVKITAERGEMEMDFYLSPVLSEYDDGYKAGIWVRDSSAGIGTMTYYNPETLGFGGLGHAICDIDTGELMPLNSGEIVDVNISGVNIGQSGKPGELKGTFSEDVDLGRLYSNTEAGIFGVLDAPMIDNEAIPMALKQEIVTGNAQILVTVSGNKPQAFDITIEKINYANSSPSKNMVLRIVDEDLLKISGGIVQGMSGSPIIQDGKLVGAVTHVFVNDPTRGYGIFAENMDNLLENVENSRKQ